MREMKLSRLQMVEDEKLILDMSSLVKDMVFPVVRYRCESSTIRKTES